MTERDSVSKKMKKNQNKDPATQEAEVGRSPEPRSLRPACTTKGNPASKKKKKKKKLVRHVALAKN